MTRKEWMEEKHPRKVNEKYKGGVRGCPDEYADLPDHKRSQDMCRRMECEECWNKDIEVNE